MVVCHLEAFALGVWGERGSKKRGKHTIEEGSREVKLSSETLELYPEVLLGGSDHHPSPAPSLDFFGPWLLQQMVLSWV